MCCSYKPILPSLPSSLPSASVATTHGSYIAVP